MRPTVTVIIPYFQRQPGLLRAAVQSALDQTLTEMVDIVVIDDGSPICARDELTDLLVPPLRAVNVLVQDNRGPAAARNAGLARIFATEFVAFLDSDDHWLPHHLERAARALRQGGCQIYLSDWMPLDSSESAHSRRGIARVASFEAVAYLPNASALRSDLLVHELSNPFASLPSMVYRWDSFRDLRFDEELTIASEDRLFRYGMALRSPDVVVSHEVETICGRGININAQLHWSHEQSFLAWRSRFAANTKAIRLLASARPDAYNKLIHQRANLRLSLIRLFFHFARRNARKAVGNWVECVKNDSSLLHFLPFDLARYVGRALISATRRHSVPVADGRNGRVD